MITIIHPAISLMEFLTKGAALSRTGIDDTTTAILFENEMIYGQIASFLRHLLRLDFL